MVAGPDDLVAELVEALPSGSHLFVTDFVDTGDPVQAAMERAGLETLGNGWIRSPEEIRAHFTGLPLLPLGLDFLARWFPEDPEAPVPAVEDLAPHQRVLMAGIARKP
ncbi:hypothetical protein HDA32_003295 [Spinactinospora alkalitolerans]|uniref:Uncharacterized protein n=1 Tax=Spinactinospora alkalitolerans TaxID=687207 RepID=A0A852TXU8_9ACTN|nr:SAM-dependent methyltransferase [Spinactinospora alkalitolerans]NYE48175.1 hypothetical protein [Spinactinospora alkalitolerans]